MKPATVDEVATMPNPEEQDVETRIRTRAYELYVERGMVDGQHEEHWMQAEQEILGTAKEPLAFRSAA